MPIEVTNITFADEFNSGTTSNLNNANVGDIITATIDIDYSNIIDASTSGSYQISGADGQDVSTFYSGKQIFVFNSALSGSGTLPTGKGYTGLDAISEYQNLKSAEITCSGFTGGATGLNTTFTINRVGRTNSGEFALICSDNWIYSSNGSQGNNARIAVTETISHATFEYGTNGRSTSNIIIPSIEVLSGASNILAKYQTTTTTIDAATTGAPVTIPFSYITSYETGSLTIDGDGVASDVQSFIVEHIFRLIPVSVRDANSDRLPSDFLGRYDNKYDNLYDDAQRDGGYIVNFTLSNQVTGGAIMTVPNPIGQGTSNLVSRLIRESGTVGVFGTNYLGNATDYSVSSVSIVRTSDSTVTDVPIVEEKFTVSFDIDSTVTPFSNSNTKVKVGIEGLPETIGNAQDYEQEFISDYAITTLGAGAVAGSATGNAASITNYTATFNSTSSVTISFDVDFTSGAQTQLDSYSEPYFVIYCETQNHTLDYTNSDRVALSVFEGVGISRVLVDPITVDNTQFITAPYDDFSTGIDASEIDGFPVQLLVANTRFSCDWASRSDLRIETVTQRLVLKNTSTLEEIELEGTIIPVSTFNLIANEHPNANYSVLKGFKIPSTEVRNRIQMYNVFALDSADVHFYEVQFPFFIRWEEYTEIILNNIPATIIDTNEPFDGVNYDVYRIDQLANWELDYRVIFNCSEGGTNFEQEFDYTISTSTYDSHPDITARAINSYKEDGVTSLTSGGTKYIESTEKTLIEAEFTFSSAPTNVSDFEIEIYIEAFENGSPTKIQRISSTNNLLSGSWFTDTGAGDGLVAKSIDGSKAVGKVYVNNSTLVFFDNYRVYATIYDPKRPTEYILAESGDNLVAENGDKFIRDF